MGSESIPLDDRSLPGFVEGSGLPVLVDFLGRVVWAVQDDGAALRGSGRQLPEVRFAKVDTDAAPQASLRHRIRTIPTMVLFRDGQELARLSGAIPAGQLVGWLRQHIA